MFNRLIEIFTKPLVSLSFLDWIIIIVTIIISIIILIYIICFIDKLKTKIKNKIQEIKNGRKNDESIQD